MGLCKYISEGLQAECEERELEWQANVENNAKIATKWDNTKPIRWCTDEEFINPDSLNSFVAAIHEYESALPGCLNFE